MKKGYVVLESGEMFAGEWLGGANKAGEVVFNTSHSGYEEIATDPSYFSQIMVMTAPQQGNYGSHKEDWESKNIFIQGFVSLEMQNTKRDSFWLDLLTKRTIPVIEGLDTRKLVLHLRESGTPWGAMVQASNKDEAWSLAKPLIEKQKQIEKDWTWIVSRKTAEFYKGMKANGPRVAILDYGVKENSIRELVKRCSDVAVFPGRTDVKTLLEWQPEGFLLSNGPGDPGEVQHAVQNIQSLLGQKTIFGICMGHQLLAQALGAKTYKLKFGHRGANHPVRDFLQNSVYMTSQNHGYAVDDKTLPTSVKATHINLYDKTNEGIECKEKRAFSVQFHPESCPGPRDAVSLFDYFLERLR